MLRVKILETRNYKCLQWNIQCVEIVDGHFLTFEREISVTKCTCTLNHIFFSSYARSAFLSNCHLGSDAGHWQTKQKESVIICFIFFFCNFFLFFLVLEFAFSICLWRDRSRARWLFATWFSFVFFVYFFYLSPISRWHITRPHTNTRARLRWAMRPPQNETKKMTAIVVDICFCGVFVFGYLLLGALFFFFVPFVVLGFFFGLDPLVRDHRRREKSTKSSLSSLMDLRRFFFGGPRGSLRPAGRWLVLVTRRWRSLLFHCVFFCLLVLLLLLLLLLLVVVVGFLLLASSL